MVMCIVGLFSTIVVIYILAFLISILSPTEARVSIGAVFLAGVFIGFSVGFLKIYSHNSLLIGIVTGFSVGLIWLVVYNFRPFGFPEPESRNIIAGIITFPLSCLVTWKALKDINILRPERGHGELLFIRILRGFGMVFFVLIVLFPFYFMLSSSLKSRAEYLQDPTNLSISIARGLNQLFVGYTEVLNRFHFARYIFNSTFVAIATVVLTLIPAILGAYAVTRLYFPGRKLLSSSILLIYMFPTIVLVIPLYSVFSQLGLRDTLPGLLIVYAAMTIPVALYMLRSYFQTLPRDIEEQGLIDGCNRGEVIWRITLPLSGPALATVALYVFMIAWNEFLFAFMFLDTPEIFTLSRGMVTLNSQEVPRQYLMAGAVIITVPIMVLFFWFEKYLVSGLTSGGVKG
ncbi:MAG: carbohydrate ABC transporter permease [Spirochaetes bacterium]|nr:MAG: carbohydrate ABC transporter permease [Spirochaetota bacterium]